MTNTMSSLHMRFVFSATSNIVTIQESIL